MFCVITTSQYIYLRSSSTTHFSRGIGNRGEKGLNTKHWKRIFLDRQKSESFFDSLPLLLKIVFLLACSFCCLSCLVCQHISWDFFLPHIHPRKLFLSGKEKKNIYIYFFFFFVFHVAVLGLRKKGPCWRRPRRTGSADDGPQLS